MFATFLFSEPDKLIRSGSKIKSQPHGRLSKVRNWQDTPTKQGKDKRYAAIAKSSPNTRHRPSGRTSIDTPSVPGTIDRIGTPKIGEYPYRITLFIVSETAEFRQKREVFYPKPKQ